MKNLFYILTILLILTACSKDESIERPDPNPDPGQIELSDKEISFTASLGQDYASAASRGTLMGTVTASEPNDEDGNQQWQQPWVTGDAFSAFALYYFDTMTTLGQQFMYDQEVEAQVSSGSPATYTWTYSPVKYWPQQGYLDLFAHYPSNGMLAKMRLASETTTPDPGLTLPDDMVEDDFVDNTSSTSAPASRALAPDGKTPLGLSSLRFLHENPLDTVITFRYYCLPKGLDAPIHTDEPIENTVPVTEYDDARYQPDLMFSHRPHLAKMATSARVNYSFTHAMMGVRFWLKGYDREITDPEDPKYDHTGVYTASTFKNLSNFTINSVTFGPVYTGGECVAYDNTNWAEYYDGLNEATQYSTVPVKLRYVWNYGDGESGMSPPYGGCEYRIPWTPGVNPPQVTDLGYPVKTITDTYTQRCDFALSDYSDDYGTFSQSATRTDAGWSPPKSKPIMPILHPERDETAEQSAFIIPPQIFKGGNPYVKITYTLTEAVDGDDIPETLTFTTEAVQISGSDICVEDGEILDIYFTITIDGDDHFKFIVDAKVNPWIEGGSQNEEWRNW